MTQTAINIQKKRMIAEMKKMSIKDLLEISIVASEIRWKKIIKKAETRLNG